MLKATHKSALLKFSLLRCNQPFGMRQFITVDLSSYELPNKLKNTQTRAKGSYNLMFTVRLIRGERVQHAGMQHPEMSVCIQLNPHKNTLNRWPNTAKITSKLSKERRYSTCFSNRPEMSLRTCAVQVTRVTWAQHANEVMADALWLVGNIQLKSPHSKG